MRRVNNKWATGRHCVMCEASWGFAEWDFHSIFIQMSLVSCLQPYFECFHAWKFQRNIFLTHLMNSSQHYHNLSSPNHSRLQPCQQRARDLWKRRKKIRSNDELRWSNMQCSTWEWRRKTRRESEFSIPNNPVKILHKTQTLDYIECAGCEFSSIAGNLCVGQMWQCVVCSFSIALESHWKMFRFSGWLFFIQPPSLCCSALNCKKLHIYATRCYYTLFSFTHSTYISYSGAYKSGAHSAPLTHTLFIPHRSRAQEQLP